MFGYVLHKFQFVYGIIKLIPNRVARLKPFGPRLSVTADTVFDGLLIHGYLLCSKPPEKFGFFFN